ncbi:MULTISPECIES: acyl-CoA dehydrogenase [Desulfococcus]|uniref:Cyclohex-1-ene-1-carbonyl-CoA dehydrogenase n=1 Tax=Desulfococcus multivorans DSM 2059 TaxID=1121405 RepID=S7UXQ0_DESML|nr:acyl-CoA dehydrogenase [Desulfococcus multivorans]AOY57932.1 acyl-CoA dehydrogenase, short-chain specific [Desulfococcus multivorans]AQV00304.1 acyl-CoA dehydrogenase [Desulfococcus multivorans]EPR39014.1 acyl-CoA dehydrogenase domain-containing protein [Desulfococcus multivorans DSM 2059]SJZ65100.1 butyryl-CoA dehydrogenase [Desulfococcus multivorans DSM 2059]
MAFFKLTDEQLMIQSMVREFSRKVVAATAAERDKSKEFPAENLKQMGELGLMGMMVPVEYGGEGADTISYVLALSEIAYSCASTAVVMSVHNSIVCESILNFGSEAQKKRFLPRMTDAEIIGAFALTEPHAGSDPVSQLTTAVKDGDHYVINGTKRFITTGKNCGLVIVTAKTDEAEKHRGISAFIVEKGTPGLIVGNVEDKMGLRASDTTDLIFEDCRVPAENLLGREGDGFKIAMKGLDGGRIGIAAQSVGVAQAALDNAVKYAKGRDQFGQKISKFQGIRWYIADMATEIEAARQLMFSAAAMKDRGEKYTQQASMAKLFASEMVNRITGKCLQIHGGYGFTKDYVIERLYRDARVFTIYEGTSEIQRVVISNNILKDKRKH